MQEVYNGIWREIASRIRPHLSTDAFQRWFAAIELVEADEAALTLQVQNSIYQFWIESNYVNVVESAVRSVLGSPRSLKFHTADDSAVGPVANAYAELSEPATPKPQDEDLDGGLNHGMNPRHRFEAFVVGANNHFAHAPSLAVSPNPAENRQPHFIYGGLSLGITHLSQSL